MESNRFVISSNEFILFSSINKAREPGLESKLNARNNSLLINTSN